MKVEFHIITTQKGVVRTTKNLPSLNWNEIAIKMELSVPDELFKRPHLEAKIVVPEGRKEPFKVDVLDTMEEAITKHTGYPVTVRLVEEKKTKKVV